MCLQTCLGGMNVHPHCTAMCMGKRAICKLSMAVRKVPLSAQKCINVFFFLILEFDLIIVRLI